MGLLGPFRRLWPRSNRSVFTDVWRRRAWGDFDTASGEGSTLAQTERIRAALPGLFERLAVKTLLDAPCGDFHWMKEVALDSCGVERYLGADVVSEIVEANRRVHGRPGTREFVCLDLERDALPRADLVLCRDALVHLPLSSGVRVVENVRRSGARWLLATTYPGLLRENAETRAPRWRPLDLTLPPFALPPPYETLNEGSTERDDYAEKSLGLWRLDAMAT